MAFDGITLNKIVCELQTLVGGKINHIYEPTSNNLIIGIYNGANYALNIDTTASNYRINLTTTSKPNPFVAPNFCMLLRKYLVNGRITNIYTIGLERICYIDIDCFNEMNDKVTRTLSIELMGKYSNVVLFNESKSIIDALKKFDGNGVSRDIMPARKYELPIAIKLDFLTCSEQDFINAIINSEFKTLETAVPNLFNGICKMFIQSCLDCLKISNTVSNSSVKLLYNYIKNVINDNYKNSVISSFKSNYSIILKNSLISDSDDNDNQFQANFFLDDFYTKKSDEEEYINYRNSLLKVLSATLDKIVKKLDNINEKISSCDNMNDLKICGELLINNIYRFTENYEQAKNNSNLILITEDTKKVSLENYYDENKIVEIEINPSISISKNADKYFKKYNKAKSTLAVTKVQKVEAKKELNYIESLVYELDNCKNIAEVDDVYNEVSENILFNDMNIKSRNKNERPKSNKNIDSSLTNFIKIKVDDFDALIGKNNKQNDYLTMRLANDNDYWFHAKDIHGSHVVLRCDGVMPKISTITKCAELAAYYSKAKFSSHVPVDYVPIKYVKKPNGSAPGYVIFTNNKTIYVNPSSGIDF